jgi:hypothetical protein
VFLDARTVASVPYCDNSYLFYGAMLQRHWMQIDTGVGWPVAPENWYAFNAPYNGTFVFDSCQSSFDTYVASDPCLFLIAKSEVGARRQEILSLGNVTLHACSCDTKCVLRRHDRALVIFGPRTESLADELTLLPAQVHAHLPTHWPQRSV